MEEVKIKIKTLSPILPGNGQTFGTLIDSDIVFDEIGIPYIPAKRIKGLLRDSASEVLDMLYLSNITNKLDLSKTNNDYNLINSIFGLPGENKHSCLNFSNLHIPNYDVVSKEIATLLISKYNKIIDKNEVISSFTNIRKQTSIDPRTQTALKHSLRTLRVINKDLEFESIININYNFDEAINLLILATKNLKRMGTKRNRGFGEIKCLLELSENQKKYWRFHESIEL
jgi:CRISPR-associated protein Csx10